MSTGRQYEFSEDQNQLIGKLASQMSLVGLFLNIVGVIQIIFALAVVGYIYGDKIPADWKAKASELAKKVPDDYKKQVEDILPSQAPPRNWLWAIAGNIGVLGLLFLMFGTWTRTSSGAFRQIVDTQGRDISHLMSALGSLQNMYGLIYTFLLVAILFGVAMLGWALYNRFMV